MVQSFVNLGLWQLQVLDTYQEASASASENLLQLTFIGFNAFADFAIALIATYEIWHYSIMALKHKPSPIHDQFRDLNPTFAKRRLWQTITLGGPLILYVCPFVKTT
jgi:hypothetical protein